MLSALALFALVAILVGYFFYRKKAVAIAMGKAVQMVKRGLFTRLRNTYSSELDDDVPTLLATAVTNYIFSEEPTAPDAVQFQTNNKDRVEREARLISQDRQICQLITQAVRTQATVVHTTTRLTEQSAISALERLRSLGILVAGDKTTSSGTFISAALALYTEGRSLHTPASLPSS